MTLLSPFLIDRSATPPTYNFADSYFAHTRHSLDETWDVPEGYDNVRREDLYKHAEKITADALLALALTPAARESMQKQYGVTTDGEIVVAHINEIRAQNAPLGNAGPIYNRLTGAVPAGWGVSKTAPTSAEATRSSTPAGRVTRAPLASQLNAHGDTEDGSF